MRSRLMKSLLLAATLLFAAPALAHATLVYQTGVAKLSVRVAADDGSGARRLVAGSDPHLSPDGKTVAYVANVSSAKPSLRVISVTGGTARTVLRPVSYGVFDWSSDSRYIVAMTGPLNGKQKLVLIDLVGGSVRTVARGFFSGASFSPAGDRLAYGLVRSDRQIFSASNLYVAPVAGGAAHALTHDGHALDPVWGPQQIAYVHWKRPTGKHRHEDGPKFNIWLIRPDGGRNKALTHDRIPFLLTGLSPTAWSADGTRLLAQFGGQDTTYAVTINPATGRERVVGRKTQSIVGTALSHDGSTILGYTGGAGDDPRTQKTITVPYAGGTQHVLARGASNPDWDR